MAIGRGGAAAVEAVRPGRRVRTWLSGEDGYADATARPDAAIDPSGWRVVWLGQEWVGGYRLEVGLLRPLGWLGTHRITGAGDRAELDLPEMGAEGAFQVLAVDPCPEVEGGPGRVVTGVFRHSRGVVYDVWVEGGADPVGVTAGHPVWSADRGGWVPAGELLPGERVRGEWGLLRVRGRQVRGDEPVYNIEVDADHCYRVGEQGILVHNSSVPVTGDAASRAAYDWAFCHPCRRTKPKKVLGLIGTRGDLFESRVEVAVDKNGNEISYADAGLTRDNSYVSMAQASTKPVVCKVFHVSGPLQTRPPQGIERLEWPQRLMNGLLLRRNPDAAVNTNTFNAGHLIAVELGGPDSVYALVPLDADLNKSQAWRNMEKKIATPCLYDPNIVSATMTVDVTYGNTGYREFIPSELNVNVVFNPTKNCMSPVPIGPKLKFYNRSGDTRSWSNEPCLSAWKPENP